jgi:hypothetical protein
MKNKDDTIDGTYKKIEPPVEVDSLATDTTLKITKKNNFFSTLSLRRKPKKNNDQLASKDSTDNDKQENIYESIDDLREESTDSMCEVRPKLPPIPEEEISAAINLNPNFLNIFNVLYLSRNEINENLNPFLNCIRLLSEHNLWDKFIQDDKVEENYEIIKGEEEGGYEIMNRIEEKEDKEKKESDYMDMNREGGGALFSANTTIEKEEAQQEELNIAPSTRLN